MSRIMPSEYHKSASSGQSLPLMRKLDEASRQLFNLMRDRNPFKRHSFHHLNHDLVEYRSIASEFGGFSLDNARIFEIGCGQRPYRLCWLRANGLDASGIDKDKVVFRILPGQMADSLRRNGWERTAKTAIRYWLFDISENRQFRRTLSRIKGSRFKWPQDAIIQGDASLLENWPAEEVDFVYSEDVFEHVPADVLPCLCACMAEKLSERGIAVVRPMVYPGIQGGHNVEYYSLDPSRKRKCPPWDHLRAHRFPANTYLNRMSRADYRALFSEYFEILDERVRDPDKGRAFLTDAVRAELSEWYDEELFSNHVRFVLRPRRSST